MAALFAAALSTLRSRAALVLARLASISSCSSLSRCFSALARWICGLACQLGYRGSACVPGSQLTCSTRARLCLKELPLARW